MTFPIVFCCSGMSGIGGGEGDPHSHRFVDGVRIARTTRQSLYFAQNAGLKNYAHSTLNPILVQEALGEKRWDLRKPAPVLQILAVKQNVSPESKVSRGCTHLKNGCVSPRSTAMLCAICVKQI